MTVVLSEVRELSLVSKTVAQEAAGVLMQGYRSRPRADEKSRADLVTEFDRRSEELVKTRLAALTPEIPVVGEETGGTARPQGLVWYVDPLDGTTNFVHGHPFFAVAVGLMYNDEPIAGTVIAPVMSFVWRSFRTPSGSGEALRNEMPCAVSQVDNFQQAMLGTGFPGNREVSPDNNFASFFEVKRTAQAVRRCGAAAIDLCFVGDGTYDGFWERRLHTWDVCAASALVLAAGGKVTAIDGGPIRYHAGYICASNGKIHDALVQTILRGEKKLLP
ncbi:MAG: inositol monophosphatase [Polyangiaceae bacterium]|nr:inositol monophosphatase [Polyangiaceae bacterium]